MKVRKAPKILYPINIGQIPAEPKKIYFLKLKKKGEGSVVENY